MSEKHTAGPWLRSGSVVYALMHHGWRGGIEQFRNRFSVQIHGDRECSAEEVEANACLIAAAPQLLECLRQLLDGMVDVEDPDDGVLRRSRAAIALATNPEQSA